MIYIYIYNFFVFSIFRNLGNNVFPVLPTLGLSGLLHLKTFNNPALREFPAPERFPRVQTMVLSYAYHCCSFLSVEVEDPVTKSSVRESILFPTDNDFDMSLWNSSFTDIWPQLSKWFDILELSCIQILQVIYTIRNCKYVYFYYYLYIYIFFYLFLFIT